MKNSKGFTLIEVIIVVAIIGIMAAISIPAISSWLPNYRLKGAARDMYSMMQKARMEAVKRNRETAIIFDVANNKYCFSNNWDSATSLTLCSSYSQGVDLSTVGSGVGYGHGSATTNATSSGGAFPSDNVSYSLPSPGPANVVVFNSRGLSPGVLSGYVYLDNKNNTTYAVGSSFSGVIRILKWRGGSWQ